MKRAMLTLLCGMAALCLGCTALPRDAMRMPDSLMKDRTLQSRTYEAVSEQQILAASAGVLQDLGYMLEESNAELGLVVGSKTRSAVLVRQKVSLFLVACCVGMYTPADKDQTFWASVTTHARGSRQVVVRVTFQRVVRDSLNQVTRKEPLQEPEFYQDFFDRLSKAVFLEAQQT